MSRNLFVLGAGASRAAGGPLMRDFLDTARRVLNREDPDLATVLQGRDALRGSYAYARLDLLNLESLLTCFEMASLIDRLPGLTGDQVAALLPASRRLIAKTLSASIRCARGPYCALPPEPYGAFVEQVLFDLRSVSIISFNYDTALELALACAQRQARSNPIDVDYCLDGSAPDAYHLRVLKLHGSLNWGRCSQCGVIVPWRINEFLAQDPHANREERSLRISEILTGLKHCGDPCDPDPVIVPPTLAKSSHHSMLAAVWQKAAKEISEASSLFVIGYSLPETDYFFRYLFGLGSIGAELQRIWIVDPKPEPVEARFREFLGPEALPYIASFAQTFHEAIPAIRELLKREDQYW